MRGLCVDAVCLIIYYALSDLTAPVSSAAAIAVDEVLKDPVSGHGHAFSASSEKDLDVDPGEHGAGQGDAEDTISGVKLPKKQQKTPHAGVDTSFEDDSTVGPADNVNSCLLKCKDDHMMKMDSEWSMDFAFPLLSLLMTNGSVEAAKTKSRGICEDNEMLDLCLRSCPPTSERRILRLGLHPWRHICRRLEDLMSQFDCWKANIDNLMLGCYIESHNLRKTMETLTHNHSLAVVDLICKDINVLSICSIEEYSKFCGDVTKMLLVKLFQSSRHSITEMLRVRWPVLPDTCSKKITYYTEEEAQLAYLNSSPGRVLPILLSLLLLAVKTTSSYQNG